MKTAIFDLDGTIADTIYDLADAVNFGLRRMNLPEHSIEQYKNFVGNGVQRPHSYPFRWHNHHNNNGHYQYRRNDNVSNG